MSQTIREVVELKVNVQCMKKFSFKAEVKSDGYLFEISMTNTSDANEYKLTMIDTDVEIHRTINNSITFIAMRNILLATSNYSGRFFEL